MDAGALVQQLGMNDCSSRNLAKVCTNESLSTGTIFVFNATFFPNLSCSDHTLPAVIKANRFVICKPDMYCMHFTLLRVLLRFFDQVGHEIT